MNLHHAMFILLLVSILLSGHHAAQAAEPLNVVFIVPDDLGCRDLGCYGSTFYETPTIDGFAREGIRLTAA